MQNQRSSCGAPFRTWFIGKIRRENILPARKVECHYRDEYTILDDPFSGLADAHESDYLLMVS
jgi:hypothetical protein